MKIKPSDIKFHIDTQEKKVGDTIIYKYTFILKDGSVVELYSTDTEWEKGALRDKE